MRSGLYDGAGRDYFFQPGVTGKLGFPVPSASARCGCTPTCAVCRALRRAPFHPGQSRRRGGVLPCLRERI